MKKIAIMMAAVVGLMAGSASATSIFYDGFDYTAGSILGGQGSWVNGGSGVAPVVSNGNLAVSGLPDATGKVVYIAPNGASSRFATRTFDVVNPSTNLFASFALNVQSMGAQTNGFLFALWNAINYNGLCIRSNASGNNTFDIGAGRQPGSVSRWDTGSGGNGYALNQTNFIVMAITNNNNASTTTDGMAVWVNPSSSTFGNATPPSPKFSADCRTTINSLSMARINDTGDFVLMLDELRVGTTWADVTPQGGVQYTLTVNANPGGFVTGGGTYADGANPQIVATASNTFQFVNWTGDVTSVNATTNVPMTADKTVWANFETIPTPGTVIIIR